MRPTFLFLVLALALFDIFGSLANGDNELTRFDRWVSASCEAWNDHSPWVADLFRPITSFGDGDFLTLVSLLTVLAMTLQGRYRLALAWMLAAAAAWELNTELKWWYGRLRPRFAHPLVSLANGSFPSGHTLGSAVVYGLLAYWLCQALQSRLTRTLAAAALVLLILAVAVSRVVLGAHWPSDVVAGLLIGSAWAAVCVPILNAVDVEGNKRLFQKPSLLSPVHGGTGLGVMGERLDPQDFGDKTCVPHPDPLPRVQGRGSFGTGSN